MKKLLIISPNFPPVNAADMHRVRQSVGYFIEMGWVPTVVMVNPVFSEYPIDPLLIHTLPENLEIIEVDAFPARWTRRVGLGNLAFRSLWFYLRRVNALLQQRKFDLIYFSTTMFPVLTLGAYWKKRFHIPYVIDMQDPWHSDYYQSKPKHERPSKYWFSYRLNKYLEPVAMRQVSGIISVSQAYNDVLQGRYANIQPDNCTVIPFGAFDKDLDVLKGQAVDNPFFKLETKDLIQIAYVGRAGYDMHFALTQIFRAFQIGLRHQPSVFSRIRMYFVGTDYAPEHLSKKTVVPIAQTEGVADYVIEHPVRVSYFTGLQILKDANMLLMPGSDDSKYTASKLYPYILARKPLLTIFHDQSSVNSILRETGAGTPLSFSNGQDISASVYEAWSAILQKLPFTPSTNWQAFKPYTAQEMAKKQVLFFKKLLNNSNQ